MILEKIYGRTVLSELLIWIAKAAAQKQKQEQQQQQKRRHQELEGPGCKLPMAKWPVASCQLPVARSCRLTMCVRKGFKKCRIPEAAVQSVELKNERTDRGRRLDGIGLWMADGDGDEEADWDGDGVLGPLEDRRRYHRVVSAG
ncbi:uncharacterized protein LOC108101884 [Drosophila ficusphila]|uniref:uncharacterized protein LOC108101884 n=1 Tax=Drosophila ficusphila TaxID=30025 RepID=UPI0007E7014E|nr:uncharacterized protein LOC108101884 [Drosophila ficusphila]